MKLAIVTVPSTDPLVAVGAAFVDATPGWLKDAAVAAFGTADKLVLGVGEAIVLAALAAVAGVAARRRWSVGAVLVVLLGGVAAFAASLRPDTGALAPAPAVVGTVAGLWTLRELLRRLPPGAPPAGADPARVTDAPPPPPGRRTFLQLTALAAAVGVVGAVGLVIEQDPLAVFHEAAVNGTLNEQVFCAEDSGFLGSKGFGGLENGVEGPFAAHLCGVQEPLAGFALDKRCEGGGAHDLALGIGEQAAVGAFVQLAADIVHERSSGKSPEGFEVQ